MQGAKDIDRLEDDMADGDLGDGTEGRAAPTSNRKTGQATTCPLGPLLRLDLPRVNSQKGEAPWIPKLISTQQKTADQQDSHLWGLPVHGVLPDLSKEELREKLQQAAEVVEMLNSELEVARRYLEGKYEALRILQGKAILDKATTHTKNLLQKSEERAKALEKDVNSLQWELSYLQVEMKKCEESWEQKHNSLLCENKSLSHTLEERRNEIQLLRAENSDLSQQCSELLSMLSVKEQRVFHNSKPTISMNSEGNVVELAVLGACRCAGGPCPCSQTAAVSRKQLMQLQQELDIQLGKREEAQVVADAFRIAFEQQLRKRTEQFLLLAEANLLKTQVNMPEGASFGSVTSVNQRLRELLPSRLGVQMTDDLAGTLHRLLDLLSDKEEALAHQRKVSIMLAHSADELQRQLHLDPHCHQISKRQPPVIPSNSKIPVADQRKSNIQPGEPLNQPQSIIRPLGWSNLSQDSTQAQELLNQPQSIIQPQGFSDQSQDTIQPKDGQEVSKQSNANTQTLEISNLSYAPIQAKEVAHQSQTSVQIKSN